MREPSTTDLHRVTRGLEGWQSDVGYPADRDEAERRLQDGTDDETEGEEELVPVPATDCSLPLRTRHAGVGSLEHRDTRIGTFGLSSRRSASERCGTCRWEPDSIGVSVRMGWWGDRRASRPSRPIMCRWPPGADILGRSWAAASVEPLGTCRGVVRDPTPRLVSRHGKDETTAAPPGPAF